MDRDEILSRSRKEHKEKDLFEIEVQINAGNMGSLTATILATLFFVTQSVLGGGMNFGLYAIILSVSAASFTYKAIRMKRKRQIVIAAVYIIATLILSAIHIYRLVTTYPV